MWQRIMLYLLSLILICCPVLGHTAPSKTIYIYNDQGVSQQGLQQILEFLHTHIPARYNLQLINAEQIAAREWMQDARMLIIGGGADLPYTQRLRGAGNRAIKEYVYNGGTYVGICAGAYYAASYVEFDKNGPLEVLGARDLAFFPGKAIGPILSAYDYQTNSGARAAKLHTCMHGCEEISCYYNGGGFFAQAHDYDNVEVIAVYAESQPSGLPAIIRVHYGHGVAILSAVHFEYNPQMLAQGDTWQRQVAQQLGEHEAARITLVLQLLPL